MTLIDLLSTIPIVLGPSAFHTSVRQVIELVPSFNLDVKPQVFETNIRVLGGLLSGHILAREKKYGFYMEGYNDELLDRARDLGERLLPAFDTPTGLPYARVIAFFAHIFRVYLISLNEKDKSSTRSRTRRDARNMFVPFIYYICRIRKTGSKFKKFPPPPGTAGAGTLILEFATLTRLTGDPRFERVARRAFFAIWNRRSDIGLVGNTINIMSGVRLYALLFTGSFWCSILEFLGLDIRYERNWRRDRLFLRVSASPHLLLHSIYSFWPKVRS